jgi:hypothetical protein
MGDPTQARLAEAIEEPSSLGIAMPVEPILAPGLPEEVADPISGSCPTGAVTSTRGR